MHPLNRKYPTKLYSRLALSIMRFAFSSTLVLEPEKEFFFAEDLIAGGATVSSRKVCAVEADALVVLGVVSSSQPPLELLVDAAETMEDERSVLHERAGM